jgi:hypothetical protein
VITAKLYTFCSLFWAYNMWFITTSWRMQLGHKTRPGHCNMQHWRFSSDWNCMFVSWSLSYCTLFQSDLLPAIFRACAPLIQVPCVPECPWQGLGNTRYCMSGVQAVKVGNNLPCGVHYCKFLDFFPVWGEHSMNHGWLCTRKGVCQVCGHRQLLHQSTMGLAQEWTPQR